LFDVVTTAVYRIERPGGVVTEDRTLALKWRKGREHAARAYPTTPELLEFGRHVCGIHAPRETVERIAEGMVRTLDAAAIDERVPKDFLSQLRSQWERGLVYASEAARAPAAPRRKLRRAS
jgi:serine/threonine-protein kinase HipA